MDWECCWDKDIIESGTCPNILEGEEDLCLSFNRRILEKCLNCDRFRRDMFTFGETGHPLAPVLSLLHDDHQRQKTQIQSLLSFLDSKTLEIRFLHELGLVLQTSVDLEEVLSVALTAITAGKGFGMNRAFLLLTDREREHLKGHLAIGPRNLEEANQIWCEVSGSDMDLQTLAQSFRRDKLTQERAKFQDILDRLDIPLSDTSNILVRSLDEKKPRVAFNAFQNPEVSPELADILGVDTFLIMPLISRNRRVGMIIADNCITRKAITDEDLHSLETFAFPVAFAIERAALYERLNEKVDKLTDANRKLHEQQEIIVRMEKMALVGRITSSIAHSIRNPLMVIGGFARNMLKNTSDMDPKRDFINSIISETRQLETVLDEVLNYSDALYPTRDFWDANQLIETSLRDVQTQIINHGMECRFEPDENLPLVYIDYKQLSYCIRAIISCDMEGRESGTIIIRTDCRDGCVHIHILDSNRSVTEDELETMLTPFSTTHDMGAGSLGLALSSSILERQKIPFVVVAPPEGGITFTLTLPTTKEEEP